MAAQISVGALFGLVALGSYVQLLRRRLRLRLAGDGAPWTLALGSWLVVGSCIAAARFVGVEAVWAAAAAFFVGHRVWLRGQVRSLSRAEEGVP